MKFVAHLVRKDCFLQLICYLRFLCSTILSSVGSWSDVTADGLDPLRCSQNSGYL
jgi:hypothetical protein